MSVKALVLSFALVASGTGGAAAAIARGPNGAAAAAAVQTRSRARDLLLEIRTWTSFDDGSPIALVNVVVSVRAGDRVVARTEREPHGRFSFSLPPGVYAVTGESFAGCGPTRYARVRRGGHAVVSIGCSI